MSGGKWEDREPYRDVPDSDSSIPKLALLILGALVLKWIVWSCTR